MEKTYGDDYNKDFDTYAKANIFISGGSFLLGLVGKEIAKSNQKKAYEIYDDIKKQYNQLLCCF